MKVVLNNAPHLVAEATTVAVFIEAAVGTSRGSAVVIDGVVVPRSQWPTLLLREGQQIELITAVQGG